MTENPVVWRLRGLLSDVLDHEVLLTKRVNDVAEGTMPAKLFRQVRHRIRFTPVVRIVEQMWEESDGTFGQRPE